MKSETEQVEKYLSGVVPPEAGSSGHYHELRGRILAEVENRQTTSPGKRAWKVAVVCMALACTAAAGVRLYSYYFEGVTRDGAFLFSAPPKVVQSQTDANGATRTVGIFRSTSVSVEDMPPGGVEQMQQQLQEIETQRERNDRELVGVIDTEVNGHRGLRVFQYKYVLSDGTIRQMNEGGFEGDSRTPEQIKQDEAEIARLRTTGQRQVIGVLDIEYNGRVQRLLTCAYTLADGRTRIEHGDCDPAVPLPANWLNDSQNQELWRLVRLDQGTPLGTELRSLYGQRFTFTRRSYNLGQGAVAVMWDGRPKEKWELAGQDYDELGRLRDAGAGELVGSYEEEVYGRPFIFEQRRYTLADGTVVVRTQGTPGKE